VADDPSEDDVEDAVSTILSTSGADREEMVAEYLPAEEDWDAKTQLDIDDPHKLALIRNYEDVMPEMSHWQPTLDKFATDFLKARTSVAGDSRNDYRKILMSMFGSTDDENSAMNAFAQALGAEDDDD
jgi:hypothetical protein